MKKLTTGMTMALAMTSLSLGMANLALANHHEKGEKKCDCEKGKKCKCKGKKCDCKDEHKDDSAAAASEHKEEAKK